MLMAKEKHKATFIAPAGIGLALFIAAMVGVYNTARSFGPGVMTGILDKKHWVDCESLPLPLLVCLPSLLEGVLERCADLR